MVDKPRSRKLLLFKIKIFTQIESFTKDFYSIKFDFVAFEKEKKNFIFKVYNE